VKEEILKRFLSCAYRATLGREPDVPAVNYWIGQIKNGYELTQILEALISSQEHIDRTAAKLYVFPGHASSPITSKSDVEKSLDAMNRIFDVSSIDEILLDNDSILRVWNDLLPWLKNFVPSKTKSDDANYYSENDFFGSGDAAVYHAMLRKSRPKRIVSFGNPFANALAVDVLNINGWSCTMTVIGQNALQHSLNARFNIDFITEPLDQIPPAVFFSLEEGDILFADTSHVIKSGSELTTLLFHIVPRLKPGVLLHIHDIFWPFEYPLQWSLEQNRSFNESYALRAFLMYNASWKIEFFNHYMAVFNQKVAQAVHVFTENPGGSLWLKRI
jgi:hypothetical protein